MDAVELNKVFHDHECAYYDDRFGIVHDAASAQQAQSEVEALLGREIEAGETVLDVGCGTGWFAAGLQRARPDVTVIGVDLSEGMLGKARLAGAANLVQGDGTKLPFADDAVDIVVGRGVLHHLPDPSLALAEWHRILRPGGALVLSSEPTPTVEQHGAILVRGLLQIPGLRGGLAEEDEFWELAAMAANLHTFTADELAALCRSAGYTEVGIETAGFAETLTMTASYASHGHAPDIADKLPWPLLTKLAAKADSVLWNRVLPASAKHTLQGVAHSS
ncbi:MAG: class I SAM-dependent methyltransferase [Actinomycetia bacterium]|nr:class I SAM-dependent methyltransferase [Actinomycetes bacterium]